MLLSGALTLGVLFRRHRVAMSISAINIDLATFNELGIGVAQLPMEPPFQMRSMGSIVLLAGPNGSGKSRILRLMQGLLTKKMNAGLYEHNLQLISQATDGIKIWLAKVGEGEEKQRRGVPHELSIDRNNLAQTRSQKASLEVGVRGSDAITLTTAEIPRVIRFVPSNPVLVDPSIASENEASIRADRMSGEHDKAEMNAPAYARQVLRKAKDAGYDRLNDAAGYHKPLSAEEESRDQFLRLLRRLLGREFKVDVRESKLIIGDVEPYWQVLSPGQQILFQFACMLHAQEASLANAIIVMDEPENHLHPAVLGEIVAALRTHLGQSQLWIATHSVPLIAQLMAIDNRCLWYVDNGRVRHAGRSPEIVLEGLLGGPQGATDLRDLTMLPAQYATARFLSECLKAPDVVAANIHDPQTRQISQIVRDLSSARTASGGRLRVLDFGAGKGRMLASIRDGDEHPSTWLDYYAFDIDESSKVECLAEIAQTYPGDTRERWYQDLSILETRTGGAFDVAVMCNVLHEIRPDDWLPLLGPQGSLNRLLAAGGRLLIVEDYGIPVGERAHDYGFLLLDEQELGKLFAITDDDRQAVKFVRQTSADVQYAGRLTAHLIDKECVGRIDRDTQREAIQTLQRRMSESIRAHMRDTSARSATSGRSYARNAQLLANASIWLESHDGSPGH